MAIYRCYLDSRVLCIGYDLRFFNMHSMRRNMEHLCFYAKVVPQKTQTVYFTILMVFIGVCRYTCGCFCGMPGIDSWCGCEHLAVYNPCAFMRINVSKYECVCAAENVEKDRPVSRHTISGSILMLHSIIGVHLWRFCAHWFIPGFSHIYLFAHTDFMLTL